jgi:hypothetical protein
VLLPSKSAYDPEQETQHHTNEDRSRQRDGDKPPAALPFEVAGETAERKVKSAKRKDYNARNRQNGSEKDKSATKVLHTRLG